MIYTGESVTPAQFRLDMIVAKSPDAKREFVKIPKATGMCEKGLHYGNMCFDNISRWYVFKQPVEAKPRKGRK